jgi:hypothetical protein
MKPGNELAVAGLHRFAGCVSYCVEAKTAHYSTALPQRIGSSSGGGVDSLRPGGAVRPVPRER